MKNTPTKRVRLTRSNEYKNLRHVVPSLRRQRDVGKVEVVTEAARYIDHLHKTLIERFIVCGISDSLKDVLGTDNAHELNSQHIMNLVTRMAAVQRQQEQQREEERLARLESSSVVTAVAHHQLQRQQQQQQQQQNDDNQIIQLSEPHRRRRHLGHLGEHRNHHQTKQFNSKLVAVERQTPRLDRKISHERLIASAAAPTSCAGHRCRARRRLTRLLPRPISSSTRRESADVLIRAPRQKSQTKDHLPRRNL